MLSCSEIQKELFMSFKNNSLWACCWTRKSLICVNKIYIYIYIYAYPAFSSLKNTFKTAFWETGKEMFCQYNKNLNNNYFLNTCYQPLSYCLVFKMFRESLKPCKHQRESSFLETDKQCQQELLFSLTNSSFWALKKFQKETC